jgi:hypothetical protein
MKPSRGEALLARFPREQNLGKMRAEHFSVKFLLVDPNEVRAQRGKDFHRKSAE